MTKIKKTVVAALLIVLAAIFLYGFMDYADKVKGRRAGAGYDGKTSFGAIVVLTGGKGRALTGLELLRGGAAKLLIISGVSEDADIDSIFPFGVSKEERSLIALEKNSKSTYENAIEVRELFSEKGLDSMLLITSEYHMQRAMLVFERVMPRHVDIKEYPVESPVFNADKWWEGKGVMLVGLEFVKYYWYRVRFV
ncbi:MAG: YdcF family protein [Thermodesulfobacteriota bacterium]